LLRDVWTVHTFRVFLPPPAKAPMNLL